MANRLAEAELKLWESQSTLAAYVWASWYRLSPLHVARLVAKTGARVPGSPVAVSGLPRLDRRIDEAMAGLGPMPHPRRVPKMQTEVRAKALPARGELGQLVCDVSSRDRVAQHISGDFPLGGSILFLGDDDLVCEAVAAAGFEVLVVDVDERISGRVESLAGHVTFQSGDVCKALPLGRYDAVVLDPADGSVALAHWLNRVYDHLAMMEGARVYLSVNPYRLGRRWARLLADFAAHDLFPVGNHQHAKVYPGPECSSSTTDLWTFERMNAPSMLPLPYLDIETFR